MFPLVFSCIIDLLTVTSFYVDSMTFFNGHSPREFNWSQLRTSNRTTRTKLGLVTDSQLRTCNPSLMYLVSPPSEILLVLDFSNSLSLFN